MERRAKEGGETETEMVTVSIQRATNEGKNEEHTIFYTCPIKPMSNGVFCLFL